MREKAKKLISTKGMSREEWLMHRRNGIGGSDAPAICGMSRWGTPLSIYLDKISTQPPSEEESEAMYWGHQHEPLIANRFAELTGFRVRNCNFILQHPIYPHLYANIDREVTDPEYGKVGLECKQASQYKVKEWADGQTPEEYIIQCAHYMMVLNSPIWYLAVLIGGNKFEWRKIMRDHELEAHLLRYELDFWSMVEARTPPMLTADGKMEGMEFIPDPPKIILPVGLEPKVERYKELNAQIKPLEKELKDIKNELNQIMDVADPEGELFLCGGTQLSRKKVAMTVFDTAAFKEEQPELYDGYLTTRTQRRLTVK